MQSPMINLRRTVPLGFLHLFMMAILASAPVLLAHAEGHEPAKEVLKIAPMKLNYETFSEMAAKTHPERSIDEKTVEIIALNEAIAGTLPDPQVTLGKRGLTFAEKDAGMDPGKMTRSPIMEESMLTLSQTIPWPGTLSAEERTAQTSTQNARSNLALSNIQRYLLAKSLYLNMIKKSKLIEIAEQNLREVKRFLRFTEERFKQSIGSHMDVLRSASEVALMEANLQSLETELENLKSHALLMINTSRATPVDFDLEFPDQELYEGKKVQPKSTGSNPVADLVRQRIEASGVNALAQKDEIYKKTMPMFMVSGSVMKMESGDRSYEAMLGVGIPLFSSAKRSAMAEQKKLIEAQTANRIRWHEQQQKLALSQLERRMDRMSQSLKTLQKDVIPATQKHIETALLDYSQGKGSLEMIITSLQNLLGQRVAAVNLQEDLAEARLNLTGVLAGLSDLGLGSDITPLPPGLARGGSMGGADPMETSPMKKNGMKPEPIEDSMAPKQMMNTGPDDDKPQRGTPGMGM